MALPHAPRSVRDIYIYMSVFVSCVTRINMDEHMYKYVCKLHARKKGDFTYTCVNVTRDLSGV